MGLVLSEGVVRSLVDGVSSESIAVCVQAARDRYLEDLSQVSTRYQQRVDALRRVCELRLGHQFIGDSCSVCGEQTPCTYPSAAEAHAAHARSQSEEYIGGRLRSERKRLRLKQVDAAKRIGVSTSSWQNWEAGHTVPNARDLVNFALLGADAAFIVTGKRSS